MFRYLSGGFPGGSAYLIWRTCPQCSRRRLAMLHDHAPCISCDDAARKAAARRRYERRKANTVGERYRFNDIAERDGWRCHICGGRVDPNVARKSPMGASIDHLIPVADGGGDEASNVALSHLRCNVKRSTGGVAQLRLVG